MADPILDEEHILEVLGLPTDASPSATCARLQTGALMALIDAYDRRATRDQFIVIASEALALHTIAGKSLMLASTHELFREEALTEASFLTASASAADITSGKVAALIEIVQRLSKCPTTKDVVN